MIVPATMQLRRLVTVCALACSFALAPHGLARPATCTVKKGDTLGGLAKRYDVETDDLRRWNALRGDTIQTGQKLWLHPPTRRYRIRKGDTISRIAKREGVKSGDILAVNPGLDPRKLRPGQHIHLPGGEPGAPPPKPKRSERSAKAKAEPKNPLDCGAKMEELPKHIGYKRTSRHAGWATRQTNDALTRGFDLVLRRHRLAPRVHLLDASRQDLGPVGNHRSHDEGRDVDIAYYQKKCPKDGCRGRTVKPSQLDVNRQWTQLHYWLTRGDVEMIFIDRGLQRELYAEAKSRGATKSQLATWFQYPRTGRDGIIRHWPGHRDHLHVRFKSAPAKSSCR